ncbi:MAG TPA: sodium:alanine symporter family protein, partial [Thiomicrospira sp.]|nr:sodium:alanine symporter family protein [Thiomicrospira sp.]
MLILLLGTGVYLTIKLRFLPLRNLFYAFSLLWKNRKSKKEGDISPFSALMTAMAATVGTGNIAGVAAALFIGGPGAIFWMWITALVGMATKYSEAVLAVKYREVDDEGCHVG